MTGTAIQGADQHLTGDKFTHARGGNLPLPHIPFGAIQRSEPDRHAGHLDCIAIADVTGLPLDHTSRCQLWQGPEMFRKPFNRHEAEEQHARQGCQHPECRASTPGTLPTVKSPRAFSSSGLASATC